MTSLEALHATLNDQNFLTRRGEEFVLKNTGVYLKRQAIELDDNQFIRELIKNCIEALLRRLSWVAFDGRVETPRIEIYPEWNEFQRSGIAWFTITDNGIGFLSKEHLANQCKSLMETGNDAAVSLREGNFGQGGRLSTLYWNFMGVRIASWHNGVGWMVQMRMNPITGNPELAEFECVTEDGDIEICSVIPAPDEYKGHIKEFGTTIILMGNTGKEHTFQGPSSVKLQGNRGAPHKITGGVYSHFKYFNSRFHTLPTIDGEIPKINIFTSTSDIEEWPRTAKEAKTKLRDGKRVASFRNALGFGYYQNQKAINKGILQGTDFKIHWWFFDEETASKRPGATLRELHQFGVLCGHEIYENEPSRQSSYYASFGIYRTAIAKQVTILVEPPQATDAHPYGVSPDGGRTRLLWNGGNTNLLPTNTWAEFFEENMPECIREALSSISDELGSEDLNNDIKKTLKEYADQLRRDYYQPTTTNKTKTMDPEPGPYDLDVSGEKEPTTNVRDDPNGEIEGEDDGEDGPTRPRPRPLPGTRNIPTGSDGTAIHVKRHTNKKICLPLVQPLTPEEAEREGLRSDQIGSYSEEQHIILLNTGWSILKERVAQHTHKHRNLPGVFEIVKKQATLFYATMLVEKILEHYKHKGNPAWTTNDWRQLLTPNALTFACSDRTLIDMRLNKSLGQQVGKMTREAIGPTSDPTKKTPKKPKKVAPKKAASNL